MTFDDPKIALNKLQCYAQDVGAFFAQERLKEQADEIARLKEVIAKCKRLVDECLASDFNEHWESYKEALAAIKEEGL